MNARTLLALLFLGAGGGPRAGSQTTADAPSVAQSYHQAWFEWAVEGRVVQGHEQLRKLARRTDLTPPWRLRIGRDLAHCELLMGAELEALTPAPVVPDEVVEEAATEDTPVAGDPGPGATEEEEEEEYVLPFDSPAVPIRTPDPGPPPVIPQSPPATRIVGQDLPRLLATLDRRVERWRESLTEGDKVPRVAGLVGRRHGGTLSEDSNKVYDAATFSFVYATRDNRRLTHNDWDMQFGNSSTRIHVDMVTDDRSEIWDVGPVDFEEVQVARPTFAGAEHLYPQAGHVYLLHIRDWDTDLWVVMQPLELNRHEWVIFRWRLMEMPG